MKSLLAMIALLAAFGGYSQTSTDSPEWQIRRELLEGRNRTLMTTRNENANEIRNGRLSYNGIFIQLTKAGNPLQLVNPAAPPEYGSGWDNLVIDPLGKPPGSSSRAGLKLFSVNF